MKLAEEIFVTLGLETVELRPSLRCALHLERREGGFRQLLIDIEEGSLTAAVDIVAPHAEDHVFIDQRVLDALPGIKPALVEYVLACAGMDDDRDAKPEGKREGGNVQKSRSFADYLTDLYKYGTGWLGWSPEVTLNATPAEISLAFEGHVEMLKAIHGGGETDKPKDNRPLDEKFRTIFAERGAVKVETVQPVAPEEA